MPVPILALIGTALSAKGSADQDAENDRRYASESLRESVKTKQDQTNWSRMFREQQKRQELEEQARQREQGMQGLTWLTNNAMNMSEQGKRRQFRDQLLYS